METNYYPDGNTYAIKTEKKKGGVSGIGIALMVIGLIIAFIVLIFLLYDFQNALPINNFIWLMVVIGSVFLIAAFIMFLVANSKNKTITQSQQITTNQNIPNKTQPIYPNPNSNQPLII